MIELTRSYPGETVAYVLDDGASPDVEAMAHDLGFTYLVRPNRGWMKKAGNLRYAFAQSSGEFILLLDADFAARPEMPLEILPYFSEDPALGIVQTALQFFRTHGRMSWVERGASAVQELFYRLIQVSLDRHGGAICVGTCAIYRRTALAHNGGTTLIEHSEDITRGSTLTGRAGVSDIFQSHWRLGYARLIQTLFSRSSPDGAQDQCH